MPECQYCLRKGFFIKMFSSKNQHGYIKGRFSVTLYCIVCSYIFWQFFLNETWRNLPKCCLKKGSQVTAVWRREGHTGRRPTPMRHSTFSPSFCPFPSFAPSFFFQPTPQAIAFLQPSPQAFVFFQPSPLAFVFFQTSPQAFVLFQPSFSIFLKSQFQ